MHAKAPAAAKAAVGRPSTNAEGRPPTEIDGRPSLSSRAQSATKSQSGSEAQPAKKLSALQKKGNMHRGPTVGWAKDGVRFTREEVEAVFAFFDTTKSGVLRPQHLRDRMGLFFPGQDNRDIRMLITQPNFTVDVLWNLLEKHSNNATYPFDPLASAFEAYDRPDPVTGCRSGSVDPTVVQQIFKEMGTPLTDAETSELMKLADVDGDNVVSASDFKSILTTPSGI